MKLIVNEKEIDVLTRNCPYCNTLLDRIESEIDAYECGHICNNNNETDFNYLEVEFDETYWKDGGCENFFCGKCGEQITNDLSEAKEFIQLPSCLGE